MSNINFLSVCSGIEAASVAWNPLGWKAVAFSEIEKFPSAVLTHHYPETPNLGDFTAIDVTKLGAVDILCGGTPCQAFSVAGLRNSLADARGNLSLEFVRLAHELAGISPPRFGGPQSDHAVRGNGLRNVVWENVPGVLSTKDNAFGCFLGALVGADDAIVPSPRPVDGKSDHHWKWSKRDGIHRLSWPSHGMVVGPKGRAAWAVKNAEFFGVPQRRRRVVVIADFGNGADPAAVLFEPYSVPGYTPPSREARQTTTHPIAPSLVSSGRGVERTGDTRGQDPVVDGDYGVGYAPEIARCDATREGSSQDYETTTMVAQPVISIHADAVGRTGTADTPSPDAEGRVRLRDAGMGILEDGTTYNLTTGQPHAVAYSIMPQNSGKDYKAREVEVAQPLMAAGPVGGNQGGDFILEPVCVTGTVTHTLKAEGFDASEDGTGRGQPIIAFDTTQITSAANRSNPKAGDTGHPLSSQAHPPAIALSVALRGREGGGTAELGGEQAGTLRASTGGGDKPHVLTSAVRRLTPVECERLQGFPDGYTDIPWRGKPTSPDGPRYKALGNSWPVPVFVWLGMRIDALMPPRQIANDNRTTEAPDERVA